MTRARDLAAFVSNADGDIKFDTDTLFIDSSANRVGIGTTTPSESLHIANANDAVALLESTGSDATDDANIQLKTTNGTFTIQNDRSIGTSGALTIAGNTSNNIVVDHNGGKVGIGTSSPTRNLEVLTSDADPDIVAFGTSAGGGQGLKFSVATSSDKRTRIINNTSNAYDMAFEVAGSEYMRILGDTGGITFNGDTAAANALDDYEEGTWTLGLSGITISGGTTEATYVKVGNQVTAIASLTNVTLSGGTNSIITGLPFTAGIRSTTSHPAMYYHSNGSEPVYGLLEKSTTNIYFQYNRNSNSWASANFTSGSNKYLHFSITYTV